MLTLKAIRLGVTDGNEIFLCPTSESFFNGNLSISGILTAKTVVSEGIGNDIDDLCFPLGTPSNYNDIALGARPIDLSRSSFTNNIGLNFTPTTLGCDAFQLLDQYFYTYWLSPPPAPTTPICNATSTTMSISWTNVPIVESGFLDIELPYIIEIRIDYVLSSENVGQTWNGPSLKTIHTTSRYTHILQLYTEGSGNKLNGTTWEEYGILPETLYDFRIYGVNHHSGQINYLETLNCKTSPVGIPIAPTNVTDISVGVTSINLDWDKPIDHDDTTDGNNTLPIIERYKVSYSATSSSRYGGIYNGSHSGEEFTDITETNSSDNLNITDLYPGTNYTFDVSAKNTLNSTGGINSDGYGPIASHSVSTDTLPAPPLLSTSDSSTLDVTGGNLATYVSTTGYSLDGSTLHPYIINENNINGTNFSYVIRTTITPEIRHNNTIGTSDNNITTLKAFGGLSTDYNNIENTTSLIFNGFGNNLAPVNNNNGKSQLFVLNEDDHYTDSSTGFWQHIQMYAQAYNPSINFTASLNEYSLGLRYESSQGATSVSTNPVTFHVDDINSNSTLSSVGIKDELGGSGTGWETISGIPTYNNNAEFKIQYEMNEIAHKFLRSDKKHADLCIQSSIGTEYSETKIISQDDIGETHKYWSSTGDHTVSTNLHNTSGLELQEDPPIIQFNDFTISLNSNADDRYDEDFVVRVRPYNLYGTGNTITAKYMANQESPTALKLRIDTKSIENLNNINSNVNKGLQVRSGSGQFPNIGIAETDAGDTYDHSVSLLDSYYIEELQLIGGLYSSPDAVGTAYNDYSTGYFFSGSPSIPDYSSITNNNGNYRYTTFKILGSDAGIPTSQTCERLRITINNMTGLTINTQTPGNANHRCQIRIVDIGDGSDLDNHTSTEGWMDMTEVVTGIGVLTGTNNTYCLNRSTSTNSQRDVYIRPGTTKDAEIYIRIGIPNNLDASFSCINVEAHMGKFTICVTDEISVDLRADDHANAFNLAGCDAPVDGDWRMVAADKNGNEILRFQRYENNEWVTRQQIN